MSKGNLDSYGKTTRVVSYSIIYYHRIHFPASSGQTIQVIRDYYALSLLDQDVHLCYRSSAPGDIGRISTALGEYGAIDLSRFHMHCIVDGWFGKQRTKRTVEQIVKRSSFPIVLVVRTLDHAARAIRIKKRFSSRDMIVILELHETAIPHMVYQENGRPIKSMWSKRLEKEIFPVVDGILCTAPTQLEILSEKYPDHAPAAVLPNSFDPNRYKPMVAARAKEKERFHVRYAGQFSPWKNTDILIEMLKFLPDHVVLDIAGGKREDGGAGEQELKRLGNQHGVHARVHYFGFLPPVKIADFLQGADCLVLPLGNNIQSRLFTSPMKLFEYAASGVPMVTTRQPSTASFIEEGVHALMVEPEKPEELADAINRILTDEKLARLLAANAAAWVADYAWDKRAVRYREFIDRVFARS